MRKNYKKRNILYDLTVISITILCFLQFKNIKQYIYYLFGFVLIFIVLIVIVRLCSKHRYRNKLMSCGLFEIDQMDGVTFEHFLYFLFKKLGYDVSVTSKTHDYGADLILKKDGVIYVCQAKRKRDRIGINAVQEVIGARYYYKADKAFVITNSFFTSSAIELAKRADVMLFNRKDIIDKLNRINGGNFISEYRTEEKI